MSLCKCGCGKETKISTKNVTSRGWIKGVHIDFVHGHNLPKGENHPRWCGNSRVSPSRNRKYNKIRKLDHHRSVNGFVLEHILVAEKALGKMLPQDSVIHHIDGNGENNKTDNLVICQDDTYHKLLHIRKRAFLSCGNSSWRKCVYCKVWDNTNNLFISPRNGQAIHRKCNSEYQRKRNLKLKMKGVPQ